MNDPLSLQRQVLRTKGALWRATDLGCLIVDGPDAASFLHNLLTNDINRLSLNQGCPAIKSTPKGQIEDFLFVVRTADKRYLLLDNLSRTEALAEGIEKLHFSEDFKLHRSGSKLGLIALTGPQARRLIGLASSSAVADALAGLKLYASTVETILGVETRLIRLDMLGDDGYLLVLDATRTPTYFAELEKLAARLGFAVFEADAEALVHSRIEAGIPQLGHDYQVGDLASSLGIYHPAFNYDKGCYVGQEIIARIRTKGEVPYRLMGVHCPACKGEVLPKTPLFDRNGDPAGEVVSATESTLLGGGVAIARLKRGFQVVGLTLKIGAADAAAEAEVAELPFILPEQEQSSGRFYDEAMALFARNQEQEARALLEQELAAHPDNTDALEALGVIFDRMGDHQAAVDVMKRIIAADDKHLMANVNLSMYYMKLGDKATAEEWQAKATRISLDRRMAEARAKGQVTGGDAEAEQMKKLEDRVNKFRQIIEMDPGDVLGWFGAGKASLDLKRFGDAATYFAKAVEIQPDYSVAWSNLGASYAALGETSKARQTLETGIEVARAKGDMMPVRDMQARLEKLGQA